MIPNVLESGWSQVIESTSSSWLLYSYAHAHTHILYRIYIYIYIYSNMYIMIYIYSIYIHIYIYIFTYLWRERGWQMYLQFASLIWCWQCPPLPAGRKISAYFCNVCRINYKRCTCGPCMVNVAQTSGHRVVSGTKHQEIHPKPTNAWAVLIVWFSPHRTFQACCLSVWQPRKQFEKVQLAEGFWVPPWGATCEVLL